jgi:hypothetical protein
LRASNNLKTTMQIQTVIAPTASAAVADPVFYFHQIWPTAVIAIGLGLTGAWVSLLGYGLVELIGLAF